MKKHILFIFGLVACASIVKAQVPVPTAGAAVVTNFTGFTGAGFNAAPAAGQLDSDDWSATDTGTPANNFAFGAASPAAWAQGSTAVAVTTGGAYAITVNTTPPALLLQGSGTFATNMTLTQRYVNNTGSTMTQLATAYDLIIRNDQARATAVNFSYSTDGVTFVNVPNVAFTTSTTAAGAALQTINMATSIQGLSIANGSNFFIRWTIADAGGAGSRDEVGLDNISVTLNNTALTTASDACSTAQNIGTVTATATCATNVTSLTFGNQITLLNQSNTTATPANPYIYQAGCNPTTNMPDLARDVWYSVTLDALNTTILNVTISGLTTPSVAIWEGGCGSLTGRGCAVGSAGSLNTNFAGLQPGTTYLLQVSGGTLADVGNFTLSVAGGRDCRPCQRFPATLNVSPQPTNGAYAPGTVVTFTATVNGWNYTGGNGGNNWFSGLEFATVGAGWTNITPGTPPPSCSGVGNWQYEATPSITYGLTGSYGAGFYHNGFFDDGVLPVTPSPFDNLGDGINSAHPAFIPIAVPAGAVSCGDGTGTSHPWTFTWTATVGNCPPLSDGNDLEFVVRTLSDDETQNGAGPNASASICVNDNLIRFSAGVACCLPPTTTVTNVTCNGGSNGSVQVAADFTVVGTYNYSLFTEAAFNAGGAASQTLTNQGNTAVTFSGLTAGDYVVQSTCNANNCTRRAWFTVTQPATSIAAALTTVNPTCSYSTDGSLTVTASGGGVGAGTYLFAWSPIGGTVTSASPTSTLSGVGVGTYTVVVTSSAAAGCSATATATLTAPTVTVNAGNNQQVAVDALPATNVSLSATAAGGTGPYSYAWTGPAPFVAANTQATTFPNSAAGTYVMTVTATDNATGCTATDQVAVAVQCQTTFVANASIVNANCTANDGSIALNVGTGNAGFTFAWSNTSTAASLTNLAPAVYTVTITENGTGCTTVRSYPVGTTGVTLITGTSSTPSACASSTGSATVTAVAGTTITWSNAATTSTISNLAPGTYNVTVTNASGCSDVASVTVGSSAGFTLTASSTATTCGASTGTATAIPSVAGSYSYVWSDNNTATLVATRNNLAAGTYNVVASVVGNPACTASATVLVGTTTAAAGASVTVNSVTNETCIGAQNGTINFTTVNGAATLPVTTVISNGLGTFTNGSLPAGNYIVELRDANNCIVASASATVNAATTLQVSVDRDSVACFGGADGSAIATVSGGTSAYTYSWNTAPVQTTATATGLSAGVRNLVVTDANGCTASASVTILQPTAALSFTLTTTNPTCNNGTNGTAAATAVAGGTAPYDYLWNTGATTSSITNLSSVGVTVTVTDFNNCTLVQNATLTNPTVVTGTTTTTQVTCVGTATGTATVIPSGGTGAGYTGFQWRNAANVNVPNGNGGNTATISNVVAGTYTVTFADGNGCTGSATATITSPPTLLIGFNPVVNVLCFGGSTGSATAQVANTRGVVTYQWDAAAGNATTSTISNLPAGNYCVTITDTGVNSDGNNFACTVNSCVTITQPTAPLSVVSIVQDSVDCNGTSTGSATVAATGGTPGYTYQWANAAAVNVPVANGGQTTTITGQPAGTYTVTITDVNNCTVSASITILEPAALAITMASNNPLCNGGATGSAQVATITGGTLGYDILWSNTPAGTTATINGLSAGTYTVTVTDFHNCTITGSVTLVNPPVLTAVINNVDVITPSCNGVCDGSIMVTPGGGVLPYTYLWSNGQTTQTATALCGSNTYTVTVFDANGCTAVVSRVLSEPAVLTISATAGTAFNGANVSCPGAADGSVTTVTAGGTTAYTYLWSNGATTANLTNVGAGIYTVTVTDANGCTATATATLVDPTPITAALVSSTDPSCFNGTNGSIDISATGGTGTLVYTWTAPIAIATTVQDPTSLPSGNYSVVVSDANGCAAAAIPVVLNNPTQVTNTATTVNNVTCNGFCNGNIAVTPTGGTGTYTYIWSDGQTTNPASALCVGTYSVTFADANGCTASVGNIAITEPTVLTATAAVTSNYNGRDISCPAASDGEVTATGAGGTAPYTYLWSVGAATTQVVPGLLAGTYCVTITDANACTATACINVVDPPAIVPQVVTFVDPSCFAGTNGTITVGVASGGTGAFTFLWDPATGGQTTATATGLAAGTYTCTITDANGCTASISQTLNEPADLVVTPSVPTPYNGEQISCNTATDGSIVLTVAGGTGAVNSFTYTWNPNTAVGQNPTNLGAGTYAVTVTDLNGCTETATATLVAPAALNASVASTTNVLCFAGATGAINLTVSGGTTTPTSPYTFVWSDGQTTQNATGLVAGTYAVTVSDANGCQVTINNIVITEPSQLTTTATVTSNYNGSNISCTGVSDGAITATPSGGTPVYTYAWSNGVTTQAQNNLPAGTYDVTVTDFNGCTVTGTVTLVDPTPVTADAGANQTVNAGTLVQIGATPTASGGTGIYTYSWSGAGLSSTTAANPTFTPATPGSYAFTVTVTDANGCTATDITVVTVECSNTYLVSSFVENANCGLTDGAITLTVGTNNADFTYNWSAGTQIVNGNGVTNIGVGTYDVTITETATGCTLTQTYAVGSANTNYIISVASTPADCGAAPNGTATVSLAANTPAGATITWSDALAQTTTVANGLAAGTYNVTVTAAGCSDVALVTVGQQASFTASLGASTPSTCGAADGTATISTSIAGAYDFVWSDNPANNVATRNDLVAGTYVVIVTDQVNGCSDTVSFNISTSASPTASVVINSVTHESCPGANNGFINFVTNYTGANTPTTVVVTDGLGTYTNGQLPAGDYCVELRDATNCVVASACTTINAAQPLVVVIDEINVQCNGLSNGGGVATVTGGAGGYSYIWNGVSSGAINTNNTQPAGNVDIVVADANGCTVSNTFVITEPTPLTVNLAIDIPLACNGDSTGQITATVAGGTPNLVAPLYTYVWSGNSVASAQTTATITGLPAGTYNVTATDANGCLTTGQINLNQNPALQITANSTTSVTCNGGSDGTVNIDVVGGTGTYTYSWSNGATTEDLTGVAAGTYTLTITDSNGCTITVSSVVSQPLPISITLDNLVNTSCFTSSDGAIDITVTGGTPTSAGNYFYSWNSGLYSTQDIAGLPQGPYNLTVTDNAGCTATFTSTVGGPTQIVVAEVHTDLTCNAANGAPSGTITLTPTGGSNTYTYQWTSNVPAAQNTLAAVTGLAAGNFGYTVTDGLGCSVSGVITLSQPSQLTATFSNTAPVLCFGQATGQATVSAAGSAGGIYTYNWASGVLNNPTATNLVVGLNTVTVVESTGCTATFTVPIGGPTQPITVNAGNLIVTNPTCAGGNDGSICITQVAGGTAPYNFAWSTAQNNPAVLSSCITGLTAGTYSATITDANNCPSVIPILNNIIVTDPAAFLIDSLRVLNVSCTGNGNASATVVSVTGGAAATYAWSNGRFGQTVNNLVPGSYDVTVTSQAGCTVSATFTVTEPALALLMPFVTADTVTCYGDMDGTITIDTASTSGGTPEYTYSIDGLSFTANDIFTNLASGYYYAYVRDANGCTDSTEIYVATPEPVAITLNPAFINLDLGETGSATVDLQFTPEYPPLTYTWSSTQPYTCNDTDCTSINVEPVTDAFYNVTVTDANGCLDTARLFVNVKPNRYVFIPTAFTPNGDLNNDVFMVYGGLGVERVQEFMVFDRWGELMYAIKDVPPTDVAYGWDGKFNGKPLNPGVFVYYAKIRFVDGREVIYKGDVSLIR